MSIKDAEIMLVTWGNYVRTGRGDAWPACSIFYRMIKEGVAASHGSTRDLPDMSPIVEITEQAVLKMPDSLRLICRYHWIDQKPARMIRRKLRIDTRELDGLITAALLYVDNFIESD